MNLLGIDFEDWYHPELVQKYVKDLNHTQTMFKGLDKILNMLRKNETLATFFVSAQQNATLLYNWQDTSLVGSWAYDNVYNECWGLYVNNREIAIIGSTEGTHFFDITDPTSVSQIGFVVGGYTGAGVIHRDYHDYQGYLYAVCDEGNSSTLQIIDISNLPNSINIVYDSNDLFTKAHNIFIDTAHIALKT